MEVGISIQFRNLLHIVVPLYKLHAGGRSEGYVTFQ
jgi:hypothetical protein